MTRDPGGGEDSRRPTAVDDVMQRFSQRRAKELGVDWDELAKKHSSRSTAWRAATSGATPKLLRAIDAELTEIEEALGLSKSRGAMLQAWNELGADLLLLDDDGLTFRRVCDGVRKNLQAAKELQAANAVFHQATPDPTKK